MKVVDTHCHLERREGVDVPAILERARAAGLVHAVVIGQFQGPGDFGHALEVASEFPGFLTPTVGLHPHEAARASDADLDQLRALCARPEVAAVGEAGLDYHYDHSPREVQQQLFRMQCELARALGKPLVVHVRDAHGDCLDILRETGIRHGVIHCFTGDTAAARGYLDLGFHLSLSGVVTYKKTEPLQDAVRFAPLDRLMVETDSPYLAPVPYRGKKNEPAFVVETLKKVAELKGVDVEEAGESTTRTAAAFFRFNA
jgi:TatD DNase family protein